MRAIFLHLLWLHGFASAQSTQSVVTISGTNAHLTGGDVASTVSVPSDFEGSTFPTGTTSGLLSGSTMAANATMLRTSTTPDVTQLIAGTRTTGVSGNITGSATTSSARPSNTQPCNNYPEFCTRRYSNITEVCAHNSPFVRKNNAGSNQEYEVTTQLNDGVRMLQGQAHYVNGTLYYCHTSCDLLNAGTVEAYLTTVAQWVAAHPFDVITIIFGNYNYQDKDADGNALVTSENFVEPIEKSGLKQYIYQPPKTAMTLDDWPTLGELILSQKRVITFIDYNYNTNTVPWMLWEFYNIWETPFSPTNTSFPCTVDRPSGISNDKARDMMYMANHNLNVQVSIAGLDLLIPNTATLNVTNGLTGHASLGLMANHCTEDWGRPPNFLLVDYYNIGSPNDGSVFEVAARANDVTYNRKCCGMTSQGAMSAQPTSATWFAFAVALAAALAL